jgi:uncharacterized membrane protein YeiB
MLLFIALANSHDFLRGSSVFGGCPQDAPGLDAAVAWPISTFVDGPGLPKCFGLLFGDGVARIVRRHEAAGFLHAVLLYACDILAAYGVPLFVGGWLVRWNDRWLLVTAALFRLWSMRYGRAADARQRAVSLTSSRARSRRSDQGRS